MRLRALRDRLPRGAQPLAILLCVSALLLFAQVTEEVREGDTRALDAAILLAFRRAGDLGAPRGPAWLPQAAVDVSALGGWTVLWFLSLAAFGYLMLARRRTDALLIALSLGGASLLNSGLKELFGRARPEVVPHLVTVANASYPSGHAMLSATAYLTVGAMLAHAEPRLAVRIYLLTLATLLVVLIGLSRVYLGVHWPSDVLAGWCLGAAWALGAWMLAQRFRSDTARPERKA